MMIGYARVSTDDQNLALQVQALEREGCDRIYTDQGISGASMSRPGLTQALEHLKSGDSLIVWRLDRLGRSLPHLVQLLNSLAQRSIYFHSTTEHIDMRSSGGRLVFHMMAALAEFERALISERTRAGIAAARSTGKRIGRRPTLSCSQLRRASKALAARQNSLQSIADELGVHPRTLSRGLKRLASTNPQSDDTIIMLP